MDSDKLFFTSKILNSTIIQDNISNNMLDQLGVFLYYGGLLTAIVSGIVFAVKKRNTDDKEKKEKFLIFKYLMTAVLGCYFLSTCYFYTNRSSYFFKTLKRLNGWKQLLLLLELVSAIIVGVI
jgi:hypothetical protein